MDKAKPLLINMYIDRHYYKSLNKRRFYWSIDINNRRLKFDDSKN